MKEMNKLMKVLVYVCRAFMDVPHKLGAVKLNKILWFSDVKAIKELKRTITEEDEYVAQPNGPVLNGIPIIMGLLKDKGLISSSQIELGDYSQWVYTVINDDRTREMAESISKEESKILDIEIKYAKTHTSREVIKRAHDYSWWDKIEDSETVPVHLGHVA